MKAPNNRKGFSGWKLTKRPQELNNGISLPDINGPDSMMMSGYGTAPKRTAKTQSRGNRKGLSKLSTSHVPKEGNSILDQAGILYPQNSSNYAAEQIGENITNIEVKKAK